MNHLAEREREREPSPVTSNSEEGYGALGEDRAGPITDGG